MPARDFEAALQGAMEHLGPLPASADRRIRARLRGEAPARRSLRWGRLALAASLPVLAAVAVSRAAPRHESMGGFALTTRCEAAEEGGAVRIASTGCGLRDDALGSLATALGPAMVRRTGDGLEVLSGTVELEVDHDHPRAGPYRVRVSQGWIEVLGTHFTVVQGAVGGAVSLQRGSIRFRADDGRVVMLAPGESLGWPLPAPALAPAPASLSVTPRLPPSPPVVAPKPRTWQGPPSSTAASPPARSEPVASTESLLAELAELRARGRYEEAVRLLDAALREERVPASRERLSFELGSILTRQIRDPRRACAHWRQHVAAFPLGRYEREVGAVREQLGCEL